MKNNSDQMIKALFLEHEEVHDGEYKIYTDGSKAREWDLLLLLMIPVFLQISPPLLRYIRLNLLPLLML